MKVSRNILKRFHLDWPLLGKELLEQAAQKRMYIIRVAYALLLFSAFGIYYQRNLSAGSIMALGGGARPFAFLVTAQMIAIFLFLPPMMASALAQEKERDTLGLLFLTDLTPWELILQKYVGRLIPMLTLLFLSLPLLAVTYSLGGVSSIMLIYSAANLFLTCLAVGALALGCSSHEATTFQALVRCWGFCAMFALCCSFGLPEFLRNSSGISAPSEFANMVAGVIFLTIVYVTMSFIFLLRAKQNLEERAFIPRRNPFGHQFKQLDQYWKDTRKLVRAMLRKRDQEAFAMGGEVVRRQLKAMGTQEQWSLSGFFFAKMQVPTLLAFAIIIGALVLIFVFFTAFLNPKGAPFIIFIGGFWILALLTVPILSANAVASERINERLNAILTTPLTGTEIISEWIAPVQRWIQFLVRPLVVLFVIEGLLNLKTQDASDNRWGNLTGYLVISLMTVWIYPRLVQWFCLWIGLRIRNQIQAMMTAFLVVVAWCLVPLPVSTYLRETGLLTSDVSDVVGFLSPITVIRTAEIIGRPDPDATGTLQLVILVLIHFAVAAVLMWKIRRTCLTHADRYLGRI